MSNKPQLFCFTYAGGNASFFDEIEKELQGIEVVKLEYSGHGMRHREPFYSDFNELADDMFEKLLDKYTGGEYSLFGYSMGSISAIEVLNRISNAKMRKPMCVFLAAHEPHAWNELLNCSDEEMDLWVKNRTIQFGAVPEKLIDNSAFWRTYLPIYREDYSIIGKYDFEKLKIRTSIPAVVFYSATDTPLTKMKEWNKYFVGNNAYFCYDGNHFFIKNHYAEMAQVIKGRLIG